MRSTLYMARCEECRLDDVRFCAHNGVLLVFIDKVPLAIRSTSEERARKTADRVRVAWRGAPFHRLTASG